MSKKNKALIAVGGTGGHVFPGCNLAKHLKERNFKVELVTDKRGNNYLKNYQNYNISLLPSSPIETKNIFTLFSSSFLIFYSLLRSIIFLILNRPSIIFGMGGYSSFTICVAASLLKIRYIIYENNFIIGKANKYLLPLSKKILVSHKEIEGIPKKYENKKIVIGNIIKKEIIDFSSKKIPGTDTKKINILVLGGSQAAQVFAETLPNIFLECLEQGVRLKIYQQCLPSQNEKLKKFYEQKGIESEIFNFCDDLREYFSKVSLAITRSGSSMLAELTNAKIPFISVPLPSSADGHQFKNAMFYQSKNLSFLIKEKDLNDKLSNLIIKIDENNLLLEGIVKNQRQHSDKNVYKNIDQVLKSISNE